MNDSLPTIPLQPVKSSNVTALGYHAPTRRLAVQFKGGGVYHYAGVSAKVADQVMSADSIGRAVREHLVGKHEFTKLDKPE